MQRRQQDAKRRGGFLQCLCACFSTTDAPDQALTADGSSMVRTFSCRYVLARHPSQQPQCCCDGCPSLSSHPSLSLPPLLTIAPCSQRRDQDNRVTLTLRWQTSDAACIECLLASLPSLPSSSPRKQNDCVLLTEDVGGSETLPAAPCKGCR